MRGQRGSPLFDAIADGVDGGVRGAGQQEGAARRRAPTRAKLRLRRWAGRCLQVMGRCQSPHLVLTPTADATRARPLQMHVPVEQPQNVTSSRTKTTGRENSTHLIARRRRGGRQPVRGASVCGSVAVIAPFVRPASRLSAPPRRVPADPRQVTGGDEPRHDRPFSSRLPVRADERRSGGEEERRSGGAEERRQVPCRVDSELSELGVRTVRGPITLPCQVNAGPGDPPVAWCLRRSRSGGGSRPQQGPVPAQQRHAAGRRPPTGTRAAPPAPGPTAGPRRRC